MFRMHLPLSFVLLCAAAEAQKVVISTAPSRLEISGILSELSQNPTS